MPSLTVYNEAMALSQTFQTEEWGGEMAQSLASLSTKRSIRVRARLDPLVTERWNSNTVLFTRSHHCRLVQKRPSMCYYVCVIMHVKDP